MMMPPQLRRFALSVHLTCSVGWIGAVLAYVGLGVSAVSSRNSATVRGAWIAMEVVGWYVIVPLAVTSLLTGLVMALGSKWGLFQHYWVLFAFVLTTLATGVLLLHMPDVSSVADTARNADPADIDGYGGDLFHAVLALPVLLVIQVLNLYKPPGMTRYGWRKNNSARLQRPARRLSV